MQHQYESTARAELTDPIAQRIGWSPVKKVGITLPGTRLTQVVPNQLELQPNPLGRWVGAGMILIGPWFPVFANAPLPFTVAFDFFLVIGACGFIYGSMLKYAFDTETGSLHAKSLIGTKTISFSKIHALQLLSAVVPSYSTSDRIRPSLKYDINVVLKDGRRINVAEYQDLDDLNSDAEVLVGLLEVPVWTAI